MPEEYITPGKESSGKMPGKTSQLTLREMAANPSVTIPDLVGYLGLKTRTVEKKIKALKDEGWLKRVGPAKGGHWEVIK